MVIEVLSPATAAKDLRQKKALYERAGVREYLVVDPLEHYAIRFLLDAEGFDKGTVFAADERLVIATTGIAGGPPVGSLRAGGVGRGSGR